MSAPLLRPTGRGGSGESPAQPASGWPAWVRLLPWAAAALSAATYWPILGNYFLFDDFNQLYSIANTGFWHSVLAPHGGHTYFVRNLIFYALYRVWGLDPRPYFATALLTHVVNVYLLCRVLDLLTGDALLAFAGAALWGTARVNEGVLGWYSAYGQALAMLLLLGVLYDLLRGGERRVSVRRALCWCVLLLLGVTCYGTGIAAALVFPVMAFLLLPSSALRWQVRAVLASLFAAVPALYFGLRGLYAGLYAAPAGEVRQALAGVQGLIHVAIMLGHLLVYGLAGLLFVFYSDPMKAAWRLPAADVAAAVVVLVAIFLVALVAGRPAARRRTLAFLVALLAVYGIIAVGRAWLAVALGQPLAEAASAAHYHYTGPALLCVLFGLAIAEARRARVLRRLPLRLLVVGVAAANVVLRFSGAAPIDPHAQARAATLGVLKVMDTAIGSAPARQEVFIYNRGFGWSDRMGGAAGFPGWAAVFMIAHRDNALYGHQVRFIENDAKLLQALRAGGGRIATLVLAPGQVKLGPGSKPLTAPSPRVGPLF